MLILEGHRGQVHTLAFSPEGRYMATVAGRDTRVWLWDLIEGTCLQKPQHSRRIVGVAFAPGEEPILACCDSSGNILSYHWIKERWKQLEAVTPFPGLPVRLSFSPQGSHLAATCLIDPSPVFFYGRHGGVAVWEWNRGNKLQGKTVLMEQETTCSTFSPNGNLLAAGGLQRSITVWNRKTGSVIHSFDHAKKVHFLAWSPDNRSLASATMNGFVKIWDLTCGRKKLTLHSKAKTLQAIAFTPDGQTLATADAEGQARFWSVESGEIQRAFDWDIGPVHSVAFSEDGMRAAAGGLGAIVIWDLDFEHSPFDL